MLDAHREMELLQELYFEGDFTVDPVLLTNSLLLLQIELR